MFAPNLTMKPERALNVVGGYLAADFYRTGCLAQLVESACLTIPSEGT